MVDASTPKMFEYNLDGMKYTTEAFMNDTGHAVLKITMLQGSADFNSIAWGDDNLAGNAFQFTGADAGLNVTGVNCQSVKFDNGFKMGDPRAPDIAPLKDTFLSAGETGYVELNAVTSLDQITVLGFHGTNASTPDGLMNAVAGDGIPCNETDPDSDDDACEGEGDHHGGGKDHDDDHHGGGKDHGDKDHGDKDHGDKDHGDKDHGDKDHGGKDHDDHGASGACGTGGGKDHGDKDHGDKDHGDKDHGGKDHDDHASNTACGTGGGKYSNGFKDLWSHDKDDHGTKDYGFGGGSHGGFGNIIPKLPVFGGGKVIKDLWGQDNDGHGGVKSCGTGGSNSGFNPAKFYNDFVKGLGGGKSVDHHQQDDDRDQDDDDNDHHSASSHGSFWHSFM